MKRLFSIYSLSYPEQLVFMLQNTVYEPRDFIAWWRRTRNFNDVQKRRALKRTKAARVLLLASYVFILLQFILVMLLLTFSLESTELNLRFGILTGLAVAIFFSYPVTLAFGLAAGIRFARTLKKPIDEKRLQAAEKIYHDHRGTVIAVAGSYGKTTMKEILRTVLEQGGKTAATPGNMNVPLSLANFALTLKGDEKFVIVEFGEGYKGDVAKMTRLTDPDIGILTGLAPNHLDQYGTLENLKADLLSLISAVGAEKAFVSGDDKAFAVEKDVPAQKYSMQGVLGWGVKDVDSTIEGLRFSISKKAKKLTIESKLVGRHLIAPLVAAAAIADSLGLSAEEIEAGLAQTKPFEHRLQPRELHGAWLIDDTYNGNLEGFRAGLVLLGELKTPGRKIYVTPGLVDQGEETEKVHREIGELISVAKPDKVVLMKNSATGFIQAGMEKYVGEVEIVENPLEYYQGLEMTLAAGDIVLLQNDWTDNYA